MRTAALFIISAFIFGACAPKLTVKEFRGFLGDLRKARTQDQANAMDHLELTKGTMKDVIDLKKDLAQAKMVVMMNMMQLGQLQNQTNNSFSLLMKALENAGIKLDYKKAWKQVFEENMKKLRQPGGTK